jgi:hypothetical protein
MYIYQGNLDTLVAEYKAALAKLDVHEIDFYEIENLVTGALFPKHDIVSIARPRLKSNTPTAQEIAAYQILVDEYEVATANEEKAKQVTRELASIENNFMDAALREKADLDDVPEKYRAKVFSVAYNRGDSYCEIYDNLKELVEIFQ